MMGLKAPCGLRAAASCSQPRIGRPMRLATVMCPATKLYVGNLSWDTQKEDLETLFSKYGTVQDVFVVTDRETGRPRGFGFVTMEADEAATAAIESTNDLEFMGRNIRVNEAAPQGERPAGGRGYGGRSSYGGGRGYGGDRGYGDREGGGERRSFGRGDREGGRGGGRGYGGGRGGGRGGGYSRRTEGEEPAY